MAQITLSLPEKQLQHSWKYIVFGLKIASEFKIKELDPSNFDETDVRIVFGKNPQKLEHYITKGVLFEAGEKDFLFKLDTVGSFRVENGKKITIERLNNASDEELSLFLLGSVFGALLQQNNLLPMHASTIAKNGKAYLIGGNSGAGKSSLAASFIKRGYFLVSDDITAIDFSKNQPYALPGIPYIKLWKDVVINLKENPENLCKIRSQIEKYRFPASHHITKQSLSIEGIFIIKSINRTNYTCKEHSGIAKINLIKDFMYRPKFSLGMKTSNALMKQLISLSDKVFVKEIERPTAPLNLKETTDFIEQYIE